MKKKYIKILPKRVSLTLAPISKSWSIMKVKKKVIPTEEEKKDVHKTSISFEKIKMLVVQLPNALVCQKRSIS